MANTDPIRVLLVSDHQDEVQRLRQLLLEAPRLGCQLIHVDRLAAAPPLVEPEQLDVVLLDLSLPEPGGLAAVAQARTWARALPVVVLTGAADEETALAAIEHGAHEVLAKGPLDAPALRRSIRYAIARCRAGQKESPPESAPEADADKKTEQEPLQLYEGALQSIKSRDELLAAVSHDLRNPLSTIAMVASLLLVAPALDEPAKRLRRHAEKLDRAAKRMEHLLRNLQDLVGIESGKFSINLNPTPLAALLTESVQAHVPAAQAKSIKLLSDTKDCDLWVACDRERILQVLANLIGNAIQFTPDGGTVELRCRHRPNEVCLSVADTGPGIAAAELQRVLTRFWPGKSAARTGAGMGLAICKGIIARHGGALRAESELGRGTTFTFALPLASAQG